MRLGRWPQPGERCLDLGASPGGWTYVLAKLGADVVAVDKAPLDPKVAAMPGVEWRGESAFALEPASVGPVDWLFSDIVCYPARLLKLVERWRASGLVKNFVCTLKFQGETDHESAAAFAAIPGARVLHLHHNKHELTFMLSSPPKGTLREKGNAEIHSLCRSTRCCWPGPALAQPKTLTVAAYGGVWDQPSAQGSVPGLREEARRQGRVRRRQFDRHAGQAAGAEGQPGDRRRHHRRRRDVPGDPARLLRARSRASTRASSIPPRCSRTTRPSPSARPAPAS